MLSDFLTVQKFNLYLTILISVLVDAALKAVNTAISVPCLGESHWYHQLSDALLKLVEEVGDHPPELVKDTGHGGT